MAKEAVTRQLPASVAEFVAAIPDEARRKDTKTVIAMMKKITGLKPRVWGGGMIGFGFVHYKYESGHEGDVFHIGFAPRKDKLTFYLTGEILNQKAQLDRMGKYKMSDKGCLHVTRLANIDLEVLHEIVERCFQAPHEICH